MPHCACANFTKILITCEAEQYSNTDALGQALNGSIHSHYEDYDH